MSIPGSGGLGVTLTPPGMLGRPLGQQISVSFLLFLPSHIKQPDSRNTQPFGSPGNP